MLRSSALAMTYRSPPTKRPSAKALSLAALSPLTMAEMAFISSGLTCLHTTKLAIGLSKYAPTVLHLDSMFTCRSVEVAQALSPAALMMAPLAMWPVPTRLYSPFALI